MIEAALAMEDVEGDAAAQGGPLKGRDLIARAKEGDRAAFDALVVEHEALVLRLALRLLGEMEDAKDAAQDVFVRLYKYLGGVDEERDLAPWLYRTTVNVCRDAGARRSRRAALSLDDPDSVPGEPAAPHDPVERVWRAQEATRVIEALRRLPERERSVLILRDVEGLSTEEVAHAVGSTPTTVRSQVSKARVRLKKMLEGVVSP